jgi:starvation-inducible DNA-binding protein
VHYTVPGMTKGDANEVIGLLQDRPNALNELALTLKHVHWNVVGPNVIGVHTMLDPQVDCGATDGGRDRRALRRVPLTQTPATSPSWGMRCGTVRPRPG